MNDDAKMRRYYETRLLETPSPTFPLGRVKSIADAVIRRPIAKWETVFGFIITICYLIHFLNPYNWFSLGRFFLVLMNGFSFSRLISGFGIGF